MYMNCQESSYKPKKKINKRLKKNKFAGSTLSDFKYYCKLLRNLYADQKATVRTGHGSTDWFQIRKGVCQGCILSP